MVGSYHVTVSNRYLKYEFEIKRNITVIKGNSATGKTTLLEMIREHNEEEDSGITVQCEKRCVVLYGKDWEGRLQEIHDSIVFIDESGRFTKSEDFARAIQHTNNYYVIVSREKLSNLPYSVDEIYGIREKGKYVGLKQEYTLNEFYHIYGRNPQKLFEPDVIVTEDSNSGFDFFSNVCTNHATCVQAGGKSNIIKLLQEKPNREQRMLAIVDGAAFGAEMEEVMQYIFNVDEKVELYAPESFEYMLLQSDIFTSKLIREKLEKTHDYAASETYFSWEQFYTQLIMDETAGTEMQYRKEKLNPYYLSDINKRRIMEKLPACLKSLKQK
ncbi:MAG: translation initiation factor 2 [Firmicutes bacterium]|nr:translation initiation factor 2 [Bacillota bacterium]